MTVFLTHFRVRLALHTLKHGEGHALLLLHGLGDRSPETLPADTESWPGPVFALDFTGHGASTIPAGGGGYTSEILVGDADAALARIGTATVLGRGLGAYVGLMLAAARPELVQGVVLDDGHGLTGGGTEPAPIVLRGVPARAEAPDQFALVELGSEIRPPDYAVTFAEIATEGSELEQPVSVTATDRPGWLAAVAELEHVAVETVEEALARFAGVQVR